MSTNAASTPVPAAQAAPSADDVLSDLAARRLTLAADVDELAARLAPNNLAKVAKLKAREKVQELRSQAVSKAQDTARQVKNRLVSLAGGGTDPDPTPVVTPATIAQIQGTGTASPLLGKRVQTTGVVTEGVAP